MHVRSTIESSQSASMKNTSLTYTNLSESDFKISYLCVSVGFIWMRCKIMFKSSKKLSELALFCYRSAAAILLFGVTSNFLSVSIDVKKR